MPLTLLVAKRLLQHGQDDRVVKHKVAEVAESRCAQSGVANQRVFIQKTAGGGRPAGGGESAQHLHDTGSGGVGDVNAGQASVGQLR